MSVKFIHIRPVKFGKVTEAAEKGGTTIAYDFDPVTRIALYSVAHCSKKDNYCKRIGRDVATGRLIQGNKHPVHVPEGSTVVSAIIGAL